MVLTTLLMAISSILAEIFHSPKLFYFSVLYVRGKTYPASWQTKTAVLA